MIAIQDGVFDLVRFVLSLVAALLLQIAANLINEYFDFRRGADELKTAGQGMIIKNAVLTPRDVLIGAVVTVVIAVIIGLYLLTQTGWLLFWIGLGGVLVVITYTAGPLPLAYLGLGEIAVFIFMGPLMVLGAYYVMARDFSWTPVVAGLPIGFMVAAILHANNVRDLDADRAVNKRTLAVQLGRHGARIEYVILVGGAYVMVAVLILLGVMPVTTLLVLITLPEAYRLNQIVASSEDVPLLHQAMGRTAKLHGQFGLWLVVGWALALMLRALGF